MKVCPLPPILGKDLIASILSKRDNRMEGFAYKLLDNQFGIDTFFPEKIDIDENEMSVVIPFADGRRRDGVGDLLEVGGIRTERHKINPIVLFDHGKHIQLPIGLTEDPKTKAYTVEIDQVNQQAKAKAFFYQRNGSWPGADQQSPGHALFCEQLFDLITKGYIRAGSIGYQVILAKQLMPDYEKGIPAGLHLLATRMLECSVVVLPANGDTVRKALCLPKVCGKPLSPMLIKSLSPYIENTKSQIGYENPLSESEVPPAKFKPGAGAIKSSINIEEPDYSQSERKPPKKTQRTHLATEHLYPYRSIPGKIIPGTPGTTVHESKLPMGSPTEGRLNLMKQRLGRGKAMAKKITSSGEFIVPNEYNIKDDKEKRKTQLHKTEKDMEIQERPEEVNVSDQEAQEEPLGAQILRCIHEDHLILLEEYDSMLATLENESVKGHLLQLLESIENILNATEQCFIAEYKELEGLEGVFQEEEEELEESPEEKKSEAEQDSEDEDVVEASGDEEREEEEPTPEEAYEGSQKERKAKGYPPVRRVIDSGQERRNELFAKPENALPQGELEGRGGRSGYVGKPNLVRGRATKLKLPNPTSQELMMTRHYKPEHLNENFRNKSICPDCGKGTVCSKCGTKDFCPNCWLEVKALITSPAGGGHSEETDRKVRMAASSALSRRPHLTETRLTIPVEGRPGRRKYRFGPDEGQPAIPSRGGIRRKPTMLQKDLEPHEAALVKEAHKFLGDLSILDTNVFGDEHRHQAYHFGRGLSKIGSEENEELNEQVNKEKKSLDEINKKSIRSICGAAGSFLSGLATGKNPFGNAFRDQAKYWHNALTPNESESEMEMSHESKDEEEMGEVDNKGTSPGRHQTQLGQVRGPDPNIVQGTHERIKPRARQEGFRVGFNRPKDPLTHERGPASRVYMPHAKDLDGEEKAVTKLHTGSTPERYLSEAQARGNEATENIARERREEHQGRRSGEEAKVRRVALGIPKRGTYEVAHRQSRKDLAKRFLQQQNKMQELSKQLNDINKALIQEKVS